MEQSDILTLQAFLMTLSELDSLGDIQAEIQKLSPLVKDNFSDAMEELRKIIYQHDFLEKPYKTHLTKLQGFYQAKPRDKCIGLQDESEKLPEMENNEIDNYYLPINTLEIFGKILASDNSPAMAKDVRKRLENSQSKLQYDNHALVQQMFC